MLKYPKRQHLSLLADRLALTYQDLIALILMADVRLRHLPQRRTPL